MNGDQRRDRKSDERSRALSQRKESTSAVGDRANPREGEFEHPTHPRGQTIPDSEAPSESRINVTGQRRQAIVDSEAPSGSRISVSGPITRVTVDSLNPVRVSPPSVQPTLSLWTRAWATVALVIVMAGGALGIVAGLRGRTFGPGWRSAQNDQPSSGAAQRAPAHGMADESPGGVPAAAPGFTARPPVAPPQTAPRNIAAPAATTAHPSSAGQETSPASSSVTAVPLVPSGPVPYRTTESLAVSPPPAPPPVARAVAASSSHARRTKPVESEPRSVRHPSSDEAGKSSAPAFAPSESPETKGESEAWITEERRF